MKKCEPLSLFLEQSDESMTISKIEVCAESLTSFYEASTVVHEPLNHTLRHEKILAGVNALPVLLDGAVDEGVSLSLLERLKEPILHLVRTLSLEWLTTSVLKGEETFLLCFTFLFLLLSVRYIISVFSTEFFPLGVFPRAVCESTVPRWFLT